MGKTKKETNNGSADDSVMESEAQGDELSYEQKLENVSVIAKPMASKKLSKKCFKLIKKAIKHKTYLRNGLKDVQMRLRKGETGIVLFAGDVTPVDIVAHLPGVCEDKDIPYCFVPARHDLGAAMGVKRGCLTVLIREHAEYQEAYDELKAEIKTLAVEL